MLLGATVHVLSPRVDIFTTEVHTIVFWEKGSVGLVVIKEVLGPLADWTATNS